MNPPSVRIHDPDELQRSNGKAARQSIRQRQRQIRCCHLRLSLMKKNTARHLNFETNFDINNVSSLNEEFAQYLVRDDLCENEYEVSSVLIMGSKIELCSDILQPIHLDEWPLLQEFLKVDWPDHSYYYYWIQNSTEWKKQDPELDIQIYCPRGKYQDDATFIGISNFSTYEVFIFTKDPSGKSLYEALVQTNRFDWSKKVMFSGVDEFIQPLLFSAIAVFQIDKGIKINTVIPSWFYIKPAKDCVNVKIKVPEECYLGELNLSHLSTIHSLWAYADKEQPENTLKLLRIMITLNKNIGLFLKENNALVSWVLQNEWHGLGILQTLEFYKRKGYASVVVNALAEQLGKKGISPIVTITSGNTPSEKLLTSLNWRSIKPCAWIILKKELGSIR